MEEDHEQLKHRISISKHNQDQETRHLERKKLKLSPSTNSYDLRENRKKTWRIAEFSSEETIPVLDSQSSDNGTEPQVPSRRKRSERRKRYSKITSPCISEIELEEVAMCLIMLSGDKDLLRLNSRRDSSSLIDFDSSEINSVFGEDPAQNSGQNRTKVVSLKELKEKSNQFECTTCSKMFASYQALGGHRASHKKTNIPCSELADETTTSPLKRKNKKKETKGDTNEHECPICLKVFPSGQALGGHKRSHLLPSETKDLPSPPQLPISSKPIPEVRDFLDLNLPAPMEEQEESTCVVTFKPCWVGTDLKHKPVVSLIAN